MEEEDDHGSCSTSSTAKCNDADEHVGDAKGEAGDKEEKNEQEIWAECMMRAAEVAARATQKANPPDWVQE